MNTSANVTTNGGKRYTYIYLYINNEFFKLYTNKNLKFSNAHSVISFHFDQSHSIYKYNISDRILWKNF